MAQFRPTDFKFVPTTASYSVSGGNIVCTENLYSCLEILEGGQDYVSTVPASFEIPSFSPSSNPDPRCPHTFCDPMDLSVGCVFNSDPVCWHQKIQGDTAVYFDYGCALDDRDCRNTEQTGAVTELVLLEGGYSHGCTPGTLVYGSQGDKKYSAFFHVNGDDKRISEIYFKTAQDRGAGFTAQPTVIIDDSNCRCGTIITNAQILHGGNGVLFAQLQNCRIV